jgi:hypothetical protein
MKIQAVALTGGLLLAIAGPAFAGPWEEAKAVCADAIAAEAGFADGSFDARLEKVRDGATQRLTVKLTPAEGAAVTGECRIKRGEVVDVTLKT